MSADVSPRLSRTFRLVRHGFESLIASVQRSIAAAGSLESSSPHSWQRKSSRHRIVTLLSDFGTTDGYVGAMKGMILTRAPEAQIVDLTHEIPPQDIRTGAWALRAAAWTFPPGTIHLAVVDPGVGTDRRPLLLQSNDQLFIGPDNGLCTLAAAQDVMGYVLDKKALYASTVSSTFHGRDVFASVAGHLARGRCPEACGSPVQKWVNIVIPSPLCQQRKIQGCVVYIDRFGNGITNIDGKLIQGHPGWQVRLKDRWIGTLSQTYGAVNPGEWVAYLGSGNTVEVAIRDDNAARSGGFQLDDEVTLCVERETE